MQLATQTIDSPLHLPRCVGIEAGTGASKAVPNLFNGMLVQLPGSGGGFSLMGTPSGRVKPDSDCLITTAAPRVHRQKDPVDMTGVLAGGDPAALRCTWKTRAKPLFGAAPRASAGEMPITMCTAEHEVHPRPPILGACCRPRRKLRSPAVPAAARPRTASPAG